MSNTFREGCTWSQCQGKSLFGGEDKKGKSKLGPSGKGQSPREMSVGNEVRGDTGPTDQKGVELTPKCKAVQLSLDWLREGGYEIIGIHAYNPSMWLRANVMDSDVLHVSLEVKIWHDHFGSLVFCSGGDICVQVVVQEPK